MTGHAIHLAPVALASGSLRSWSEAWTRRYTWWLCWGTALASLAILAFGLPGERASAALMVCAVALLGLPHGSYDLALGRHLLGPRLGASWAIVFVALYLLLVATAVLLWVAAPWVGLLTLLIGGAAHWGLDDLELDARGARRAWLGLSRGALPVALPLAVHPESTAAIFAALTASEAVDPASVQIAGVAAMLAAMPGLFVQVAGRELDAEARRARAEMAVLVCWFVAAPPILAFTLYFCAWHAVRHSLRAMGRIHRTRPAVAVRKYASWVALPTVASWGLGLAAWMALGDGDHRLSASALWQVTFVGLFALTVPHVLIEIITQRTERQNPDA